MSFRRKLISINPLIVITTGLFSVFREVFCIALVLYLSYKKGESVSGTILVPPQWSIVHCVDRTVLRWALAGRW